MGNVNSKNAGFHKAITEEDLRKDNERKTIEKGHAGAFKVPTAEEMQAYQVEMEKKKEKTEDRRSELQSELFKEFDQGDEKMIKTEKEQTGGNLSKKDEKIEIKKGSDKEGSGKLAEDKRAFAEFYKNNKEDIDKVFKGGSFEQALAFLGKEKNDRSRELQDFIYGQFYNNDEIKYSKEDKKKFEELIGAYRRSQDAILQKDEKNKNVLTAPMDGWLWSVTNGGPAIGGKDKDREDLGRFYLNLKPDEAHSFFEKTKKKFLESGLHAQIKIPLLEDGQGDSNLQNIQKNFNRPDKMLIYFDEKESDKGISLLRELYEENKDSFDEGLPKFTSRLTDNGGEAMKGISFGQEHPKGAKYSFGEMRSKILVDALKFAMEGGVSPEDEGFDGYFKEACVKNGVDPENPTFNLGSEAKFGAIRKAVA